MADLQLKQVVKRFGEVQTIHGVDLEITHGEFVVFVGPSGCGKSTLLRLIAGLEEISEGDIRIDGESVAHLPAAQRGVAMVFQSYALYPHMTVRENMGFGLRMAKFDKVEIDRRVEEAAAILKLGPLLERRPKALSGGQRQRVAIGRTIVRNPKVFLFDEPLSNLDAELRVQMRVEIAKLHASLGNTMVYVTHDQVEAMTMADKIVVLRDGRIEQVGSPLELYLNPVNDFVAGFIGSPRMNFFDTRVRDVAEGRLTLELPGGEHAELEADTAGVAPGDVLRLGIRPEHIREDDGDEIGLAIEVEVVEHLGGSTFVYGRHAGGEPLTLQVGGLSDIRPGSGRRVSFAHGFCHLFDATGRSIGPRKRPEALKAAGQGLAAGA
ncbi:ABC transporter ATP-binding protein [Halomonas salifodinae]|uniref:ABC transporter ATP-binding protein n=1 Tax=Halomonas salifodinae TaxID=438745 RepID=A0ABW2F453_9GAMM